MEHGERDFGESSLASLIGVGEQPEKGREQRQLGVVGQVLRGWRDYGGHKPWH